MQAPDLDGTVRHVVAAHLDLAPEVLTVDLALGDLGLDDDCAFELLVAVEEALDVRFPDDFFDGVTTYGELTTAVRVAVGG
ncbi:MAG: acyl carrier protein [Actinobacteria bacterium]|nr:acyl carrier protein [Actinomycetota bacterium]